MKPRKSARRTAESEEVFSTPAQSFPEPATSPESTPRVTRGAKRRLSTSSGDDVFHTPPQNLPPLFSSPPSRGVKRLLEVDLRTPSPKRTRGVAAEEIDIRTPPDQLKTSKDGACKGKTSQAKPSRGKATSAQQVQNLTRSVESPHSVVSNGGPTEMPGLATPKTRSSDLERKSRGKGLSRATESPASTVTTASPQALESERTSPDQSVTGSPETSPKRPLNLSLDHSPTPRKSRRSSVASTNGPSVELEDLAETVATHEESESPSSPVPSRSPTNQLPTSPAAFMTPVQTRGKKTKTFLAAGGESEKEGSVLCTPRQAAGNFQTRLDQVATGRESLGAAESSPVSEVVDAAGRRENGISAVAGEPGTGGSLEEGGMQLDEETGLQRPTVHGRWNPLGKCPNDHPFSHRGKALLLFIACRTLEHQKTCRSGEAVRGLFRVFFLLPLFV